MVRVIFNELNNGQSVTSKEILHGQTVELLKLIKEVDDVYIEDNQYKYNASSLKLATYANEIDTLSVYMEVPEDEQ
jgi:hypothetical protein